jgi:hypothetical protein
MFATEQSLDQEFAVSTGKVAGAGRKNRRTHAKRQISNNPEA